MHAQREAFRSTVTSRGAAGLLPQPGAPAVEARLGRRLQGEAGRRPSQEVGAYGGAAAAALGFDAPVRYAETTTFAV
ncbi:hypothetical protein GCM10014713_21730 [Streptomyces purpureus]|uniref:Uncharacterized protein n=1 Tax=Streptomyces purpureus TaxID=1951 RepID=A0A918H105_9ACTN|nr:hypothetical protein GCM10014713_21730 [Streptomyces purpureus]